MNELYKDYINEIDYNAEIKHNPLLGEQIIEKIMYDRYQNLKNIIYIYIMPTELNLNEIVNKRYICELCNKIFRSDYIYQKHINQKIKCNINKDDIEVEKIIYKCDLCNKLYISKRTLNEHIKNYHKLIQYKCDICDYIASNIKGLSAHRRAHKNENKKEKFYL